MWTSLLSSIPQYIAEILLRTVQLHHAPSIASKEPDYPTKGILFKNSGILNVILTSSNPPQEAIYSKLYKIFKGFTIQRFRKK